MFNFFPKWIIDKITVRKYTPRPEPSLDPRHFCHKTHRSPATSSPEWETVVFSLFFSSEWGQLTPWHLTLIALLRRCQILVSQKSINKWLNLHLRCLLFQRNLITEEYWKVSISSCRPLCGNEKWNYWIMKLSHKSGCDTLVWCFVTYLLSLIRNCVMCRVQG